MKSLTKRLVLSVFVLAGFFSSAFLPIGHNNDVKAAIALNEYNKKMDSGTSYGVIIRQDGSLYTWGSNSEMITNTPSGNEYEAVSAGVGALPFAVALRKDGSLVVWGDNDLINGVPYDDSFVAVSAGSSYAVALKKDGSLVGWGSDINRQVSGTPSGNNFVAVSAGVYHSVALKKDGSLVAWGWDRYRYGLLSVPPGNDFVAVAAGTTFSVALKKDGSLVSWGDDLYGQVSDTPRGNDFVAVDASGSHGIALKRDGSVVSWGYDDSGVVSNNPSGNNFVAISAGPYNHFAMTNQGCLVVWGNDYPGVVSGAPKQCMMDTTSPTVFFTPNGSVPMKGPINVLITPVDDSSGIRSWKYAVSSDNGNTWSNWSQEYTGPQTVALNTEGNNIIKVTVTDNAGNTATYQSKVFKIDNTPPSVVFSPNQRTWTKDNVSVNVSISDNFAGIIAWGWRQSLDGGSTWGSWTTVTNPAELNGKVLTLDKTGRNKIQILAIDNANNQFTATSGEFQIDKDKPTANVSISEDSGGGTISGIITPSDIGGSGMKRWRYRVAYNNNGFGNWSNYLTGAVTGVVPINNYGTWTFQIELEDNAGNTNLLTIEKYVGELPALFTSDSYTTEWSNSHSFDIYAYFQKGQKQTLYSQLDGGSQVTTGWVYDSEKSNTVVDVYKKTFTFNSSNLSDGTHTLLVYGSETSGKYVRIPFTIKIDNTKPTVSFTPNSSSWGNKDVNVTIQPNDSLSGIRSWRYAVSTNNGSTWGSWVDMINPQHTLKLSSEGINKIKVEAVDEAGNVATLTSGSYYIDKSAPTATFTQDTNAPDVTEVNITINASDTLSGVKSIELPNYAIVQGNTATYKALYNGDYYFTITDNAGNEAIVSHNVTNIKADPPTASFSPESSNWTKNNITVELTPISQGSDVDKFRYRINSADGTITGQWSNYITGSDTIEITLSNDGQWVIEAELIAENGKKGTVTSGIYRIDKSTPTVTLNPNGNATFSTGQMTTVSVSDGLSGIDSDENFYVWSTSKTRPADGWAPFSDGEDLRLEDVSGTYYLHVVTKDKAGNEKWFVSNAFNIDNTPPTAQFSINHKGSYAIITITGQDSHSGVKEITLPNGTTVQGALANFNAYTNGTYHFTVTDNVGNRATVSYSVSGIVPSPPTGTFSPDGSNWTNNSVSVTFTPVSNGPGIKEWRYRIKSADGTEVRNWSDYFSGSQARNINLDEHGIWVIEVELEDNAETQATVVSKQYKIDMEPPAGVVDASVTTPTTELILTATATDDGSGMAGITKPDGTFVSGSTATYKVTRNGDYTFSFRDNSGNVSTVTYTVDNIISDLPTGIFSPNSSAWTNNGVKILFTPIDTNGVGIKYWRYRIIYESGTPATGWSNYINGATQGEITISNTGKWKIEVEITDNSNMVGNVISGVYSIDTVSPSGLVIPNTTNWTKNDVLLTILTSDIDSGVKRIILPNGQIVESNVATFSVSSNGTYGFIVQDNAGNNAVLNYTVSNIDKTLPNVSINPDENLNYAKTQSVTISASDSGGSGLGEILYAWSDDTERPTSGWKTTTNNQTVAHTGVTGDYYLHVIARDNAGNEKWIVSGVFKFDNTPPSATFTQRPSSGGVEITAVASDAHSGEYRIKLPNGTYVYGSVAKYTVYQNGTYTFQFEDRSGNVNIQNYTVSSMDNTPPYVWFQQLTPSYVTKGPVEIEIYAADDSKINRIILPDGTSVYKDEENDLVTYKDSAKYTVYDNGVYKFTVEDDYLNRYDHYVKVTNIDKEAPKINNITLVKKTNGTYFVSVSATDSHGINSVKLNTNQVLTLKANNNYEIDNLSLASPPTSVTVEDLVGNKTQETFLALPSEPTYDKDVNSGKTIKENVVVTFTGTNQLSYSIDGVEGKCNPGTTCSFVLGKSALITLANTTSTKQSYRQVEIRNINKSQPDLVLSGKRDDNNKDRIVLNWNLPVQNAELKCVSPEKQYTFRPTGTSYSFTAENVTFDCVLKGVYEDYPIESNTTTIPAKYSEPIYEDSPYKNLNQKDFQNVNVYVETTIYGETFFINSLRNNQQSKTIPVPKTLK